MPGVVEHDGQRLPATYVNFYFVNGALLVPTYRQPKNDRRAIDILQGQLPKHKVIGIDCVGADLGPGRDPLPDASSSRRASRPR